MSRRVAPALALTALCALLAAACSDAWRESRAAPEADLAGHGAVDTVVDGMSSLDPDDGLDDAMDAVDHPLVRGRLSGAEAEARLAAFARDWELAHEDGGGTVRVFRAYVRDLGVARIARHFEARRRGCHGELHNLGKVVADLTGDAATAMAVCGDACTYACIHGALKAHYAARARDEGGDGVAHARDDLVVLCTEGALIDGFYRGNCAHAAGHAFAIMAEDVRGALALCATFPDREYAYYCATGAFMQVTPMVERNLDAKADAPADPADARLDYCRAATGFLGACVRFLMRDMRGADDLARLGRACAAMTGGERLGCYNALGYLGRGRVAREPGWINTLCGGGGPVDRELCVSGFALAKRRNPLRSKMEAGCGALTDPDLAARCADQLGRHYYALGNPTLMRML